MGSPRSSIALDKDQNIGTSSAEHWSVVMKPKTYDAMGCKHQNIQTPGLFTRPQQSIVDLFIGRLETGPSADVILTKLLYKNTVICRYELRGDK